MKIIECDQYSPEWYEARRGKVSASKIADVLAKVKSGGYSAMRKNYCALLVAERLTGVVAEKVVSTASMEWGKLHEDQAVAMYELEVGGDVSRVGLVIHPSIDEACASPDRLAGEDGLLEIKCPDTAQHIATLLGDTLKGEYLKQMQWQMACTGRKWVDFISFDPRLDGPKQLYVQRIERDPVMIAETEREVRAFLKEVEETVADLNAKYPATLAA